MKITCEHCGSRIDINNDKICPGCKASYANNKEFLEHKEYLKNQKDFAFEQKKNATKAFKSIGISMLISGIFIFLVATLIIGGIILLIIKEDFSDSNDNSNIFNNTFNNNSNIFNNTSNKEEYRDIIAEVNVSAKTKTFEISCDKLEISNKLNNSSEEGYEYVSFHIIVKNISKNSLYIQDAFDFHCSVNNESQKYKYNSDKTEIQFETLPNETSDGYVTFRVPKNSKIFDLKYENTLLHIELLNENSTN